MATKKISSAWLNWLGMGLILVAIILIIWFFLRGQTITSGGHPDPVSNDTLNCKNVGMLYPYFSYDESEDKKIEVNIIFSDNVINSISLMADLKYNNEAKVKQSSDINQIALSKSLNNAGLDESSLSAKYSNTGDGFRMSIYATSEKLTTVTKKFFLISDNSKSVEAYEKSYTDQGFTCVLKDNNQ
ncbi:hypothetical protein IJG90_03700 [Candidatus Saccharibacteria bacterium]|nr:hypothetical protein [Candidatus Saccharibacteria bacterium]